MPEVETEYCVVGGSAEGPATDGLADFVDWLRSSGYGVEAAAVERLRRDFASLQERVMALEIYCYTKGGGG